MAQYDVYRASEGDLWVDCQANAFDDLNSRLVVPMVALAEAVVIDRQLTPVLTIDEEPFVLLTHLAGAVGARELRQRIGSLAGERYVIQAALDRLTGS